jgi:hypothetical protein
MFNAEIPTRAELPSTARLVQSTVLAAGIAALLLVTTVLPAEYAVDPTGVGRALGLTQMGEIKKQLAIEAEQDRQRDRQQQAPSSDRRSAVSGPSLARRMFFGTAVAHSGHKEDEKNAGQAVTQTVPTSREIAQPAGAAGKSDEVAIVLKPGQGIEYKLAMKKDAVVKYSWTVANGNVNYDLHGSHGGKESSYKKGRGVASDEGTLTAAYDGYHGWFWRNRGTADVTIMLKVDGAYTELKKMP